jgi:hypothetical protein
MTRTLEELQAQVARLRGYMGHFKHRMEDCIATLQHTQRDLLTLQAAALADPNCTSAVKERFVTAISRIGAVVSAPPGARLDVEALEATPELIGKRAVVLYFETDADRDELTAAIAREKPGMRSVNLE